jgi:hypothetical protein
MHKNHAWKKQRADNSSEYPQYILGSGPLNLKILRCDVFGFSGAGTSAPARLLMLIEIIAKRAFSRTTLLISASQRLSQHL